MGVTAALIAGGLSLAGTAVSAIGRPGAPSYPSPPKLYNLPVGQATQELESNEAARMQASIDAWKTKFPDLYKGEQAEINQITDQQHGNLGGQVAGDLSASGLQVPTQGGSQEQLSRELGLSPITLSQRTSQAVTRQIASNPQWTSDITGGTLATMLANNKKNAMAYGMFMNSNQSAQAIAGQEAGLYNTQALLGGLTGAARVGAQVYNNQYSPLSPMGQGAFQTNPNTTYAPSSGYPSTSGYPSNTGYPSSSPAYGQTNNMWYSNSPAPSNVWGAAPASQFYQGAWDPNQVFTPPPSIDPTSNYGI